MDVFVGRVGRGDRGGRLVGLVGLFRLGRGLVGLVDLDVVPVGLIVGPEGEAGEPVVFAGLDVPPGLGIRLGASFVVEGLGERGRPNAEVSAAAPVATAAPAAAPTAVLTLSPPIRRNWAFSRSSCSIRALISASAFSCLDSSCE